DEATRFLLQQQRVELTFTKQRDLVRVQTISVVETMTAATCDLNVLWLTVSAAYLDRPQRIGSQPGYGDATGHVQPRNLAPLTETTGDKSQLRLTDRLRAQATFQQIGQRTFTLR